MKCLRNEFSIFFHIMTSGQRLVTFMLTDNALYEMR
jgi:hypothetical protein